MAATKLESSTSEMFFIAPDRRRLQAARFCRAQRVDYWIWTRTEGAQTRAPSRHLQTESSVLMVVATC